MNDIHWLGGMHNVCTMCTTGSLCAGPHAVCRCAMVRPSTNKVDFDELIQFFEMFFGILSHKSLMIRPGSRMPKMPSILSLKSFQLKLFLTGRFGEDRFAVCNWLQHTSCFIDLKQITIRKIHPDWRSPYWTICCANWRKISFHKRLSSRFFLHPLFQSKSFKLANWYRQSDRQTDNGTLSGRSFAG